jgi:cbb3-type cytochrome oxidase subunit 3
MSLSDIVSNAGLVFYAEVALVIFFLVFVGIVAYVVLRRRGAWERMRHLPLDDEPTVDTAKDRKP